jgi:hypothetical protein
LSICNNYVEDLADLGCVGFFDNRDSPDWDAIIDPPIIDACTYCEQHRDYCASCPDNPTTRNRDPQPVAVADPATDPQPTAPDCTGHHDYEVLHGDPEVSGRCALCDKPATVHCFGYPVCDHHNRFGENGENYGKPATDPQQEKTTDPQPVAVADPATRNPQQEKTMTTRNRDPQPATDNPQPTAPDYADCDNFGEVYNQEPVVRIKPTAPVGPVTPNIELHRVVRPGVFVRDGQTCINYDVSTVCVFFTGPDGRSVSLGFDGRYDCEDEGGRSVRELYMPYRDSPVITDEAQSGPMSDLRAMRFLRDALISLDLGDDANCDE